MTVLLLALALSAGQPCCEPGVACGCVEWDSGSVSFDSGDELEPGSVTTDPFWSDLYDEPGVDDSDITEYAELAYLPTDCSGDALVFDADAGRLFCSGSEGWSCSVAGDGVDVKVTTEKRTEALALAVAAAEQISGSVTIECEERR